MIGSSEFSLDSPSLNSKLLFKITLFSGGTVFNIYLLILLSQALVAALGLSVCGAQTLLSYSMRKRGSPTRD